MSIIRMAQVVKNLPAMWETQVQYTQHEHTYKGLPRWLSGKESAHQRRRRGFDPWVGKIPWRRKWQSTCPFILFIMQYSYLGNPMDRGAW